MTFSVYACAKDIGPLDPEVWLPPPAQPYPPLWRGVGRRPAGGALLADLRGRYRKLVDSFGDAPLNTVHVALARQIRDDFLAAWRERLGLDPAVPLHVVAPHGARRVGALVSEPQPEQLVTVLTSSLVAAPAQNPGPGAPPVRPPGRPAFDYAETTSHVDRARPAPLEAAVLAAAPTGRRQPKMRAGIRSYVTDALLDGADGLPAAFFAGRPGIKHRSPVAQDLLLRIDRGYASGTQRAAVVAGHTATLAEVAELVAGHFGTTPARLEWGMGDPDGEHAGLTSDHAQVPRCLVRFAIGEPVGGADPRYGGLAVQHEPIPVSALLGVGRAAWVRAVCADGTEEWFAVRALAGGPAGRCCPAGAEVVVSTLVAAAA